MTRAETETWLRGRGWARHPIWTELWSHPERPAHRYRTTSLGLRLEARTSLGEWVRVRSGYYRDLSITDEGRLHGLTLRGMGY